MTNPVYPKNVDPNVVAANLAGVGFDELSRTIPLFPLTGMLLLPRGNLPLRIFEPRYLAMISDAMDGDRLIGMVQPADANEDMLDGSKAPATYRAGCVGRIMMHEAGDDGTQHITLTGICRFSIVDELPVKRGYRRALVSYARYRRDLEPEDSGPVDRGGLFDALRGIGHVPGHDVPVRAAGKTGFIRGRNFGGTGQGFDHLVGIIIPGRRRRPRGHALT